MTISKKPFRTPLVDPLELNLGEDLVLEKITGYPHAGNDVFVCRGKYRDRATDFYLKIARHKDANFANEAAALAFLEDTPIAAPRVMAHGKHPGTPHEYLALSAMPGVRMSGALDGAEWVSARTDIRPYLEKIAESVAGIHQLTVDWQPVRPRSQFALPVVATENPISPWLNECVDWLRENQPSHRETCFVHGDHHYANLLWQEGEISAVLDWELCGMGWQAFDLAWSLLPRPGQQFLTTMPEQRVFLEAYQKELPFKSASVAWCFVLVAAHFLSIRALWADRAYRDLLQVLCDTYME